MKKITNKKQIKMKTKLKHPLELIGQSLGNINLLSRIKFKFKKLWKTMN